MGVDTDEVFGTVSLPMMFGIPVGLPREDFLAIAYEKDK